ncbi:Nn.00g013610.m01.CDS01 [Neocucurbitaria sp. VM-36]
MKTSHAFACVLLALPFVLSQTSKGISNNPQKASVGRFSININDNRLRLEEAVANQTTLNPSLAELFFNVLDFYESYNDSQIPSMEVQSQNLTSLAKTSLSPADFGKYNQVLLNASSDVANETINTEGLPNPDVVGFYLDAIYNMTYQTYYYIHGAYIGVGQNSECAEQINQVLADKDEWAKMGSSAATTLMALLPTFLAFGHLFVPRSSEAYTTSALVGLTTAFYGFGLPVTSISAVKQKNVHTLSTFGIAALAFISRLGKANKDGTAKVTERRQKLRDWSRENDDDVYDSASLRGGGLPEVKASFGAIKSLANEWESRWHLWHMPALFVAAAQVVIFVFAVYPLFQYLGVPQSILGCNETFDWTGLYLGVSAGVNTVVRYIRWLLSDHERVKVYSLSESAKAKLNTIIDETTRGETTSTHLPPLLPPYILTLRHYVTRIFRRGPSPNSPHYLAGPVALFKQATKVVRRRLAYVFKGRNFFEMIHAGVGRTSSARRWRPVYILIHLSIQGRNPLVTLLTGFIEAALLLVLTLFFAAQWGGNLVLTMIALVLLLVFVTLGRALGLIYVWLSSQVWGLTVVKCDSVDEIRGVLRIVCSMEGVLVCVNGATYYGGYRMDGRERYEEFVEQYERGTFDEMPGSNYQDDVVFTVVRPDKTV